MTDQIGPSDSCVCGDVLDEHDPGCTVDGCDCIYFEAADDAD